MSGPPPEARKTRKRAIRGASRVRRGPGHGGGWAATDGSLPERCRGRARRQVLHVCVQEIGAAGLMLTSVVVCIMAMCSLWTSVGTFVLVCWAFGPACIRSRIGMGLGGALS